MIDPTSINRQGEDQGSSYRTGIYYEDIKDLPIIENKIREIQKQYNKPVVVEVDKLHNFYDAEEYHQKYLEKNPKAKIWIATTKAKYTYSEVEYGPEDYIMFGK